MLRYLLLPLSEPAAQVAGIRQLLLHGVAALFQQHGQPSACDTRDARQRAFALINARNFGFPHVLVRQEVREADGLARSLLHPPAEVVVYLRPRLARIPRIPRIHGSHV